MKATKRQKELMHLIIKGDGSNWYDIDQLIEKLSTISVVHSKQSVQCSLRVLETHGLLVREYETRRSKNRMLIVPTGKAFTLFAPSTT